MLNTLSPPIGTGALTRQARALLAVIEAQAKTHAPALSNEAYAGMCELSVAQIRLAFRDLRRAGLIEVQSNGSQQRRIRCLRLERLRAQGLRSPSAQAAQSAVADGANNGQIWTLPSERKAGGKPPGEKRTTTRPCLCCGDHFASEGAHNRLCAVCRAGDSLPSYSLAEFRGAPHAA